MRQVRFASAVAATLAALAATSDAAIVPFDIGAFSTLYGSTQGAASNGPASAAQFDDPSGVAFDSTGNVLFIADQNNNAVRKVDGGTISTVQSVSDPISLAVTPDGQRLFIGGKTFVRHVPAANPTSATTQVSTVNAHNMAFSNADGTLYIATGGDVIRMTNPTTSPSTTSYSGEWSWGVAVRQNTQQVFFSSTQPGVEGIFRATATLGGVTQVAGDGRILQRDGDGSPVANGATSFRNPTYMVMAPDDNYVFIAAANSIRRMELTTGSYTVDTVFNAADSTTLNVPTATSHAGQTQYVTPMAFNPAGTQLLFGSWQDRIFQIDYMATTTTVTTTTTTPPPTTACDCDAEKLEAVYGSDQIPDATADAISNISLDTDTWEVVFEVRNVRAIKNGHVIAAAVNTQETAANAFTPLVSAFDVNDLWNPLQCGLGGIDTPAASLKVRTEWDNAACRTKYEMRYSLISIVDRDDHYCDLTDDNAGTIKVNCSIVLSSTRAYSSTETWAFVAQEAAFAAELNLGTYLNNEVTDLLHATMAKCSVKNGPLYVVDCRVPGVWNFDQGAFSVAQSPENWINGASCASNVVGSDAATAATFIRCNIENDAPIANIERALANISATPTGNPSNALTFDVDFIVPRKVTTTASASLASFVQSIAMKNNLYFYGTADVATLEITVVDTARLSMTALELFNSATPDKQVYDIFPGTSDARFQTALNADATKFTIDFYPAAIREDSAFYRYGPHGINVSFTFSAARRVAGGGTGNVVVEGLNVEGTEATTSSAQGSAASSSSGTALMAGVAVGAAVLVAGLVGAAVVAVKRRGTALANAPKAVQEL